MTFRTRPEAGVYVCLSASANANLGREVVNTFSPFLWFLAHAGEDAQSLAGAICLQISASFQFRNVWYALVAPRVTRVAQPAMASFQTHLAVWFTKWRVKRRLKGCRDYRAARAILRPLPFRVPGSVRITSSPVNGIPGEWVESSNSTDAVMLYLHGGGYFGCSAKTHRPITVWFAEHGFRVFAPNYRLAPENQFPAAVDDAVATYRGLLADGHSPQRLVVAGDSAGGGLALSMMLALRAADTPLPAAAALFSPWTDLAGTGESIRTNAARCAMFNGADIGPSARYYLGNADPRNPLASPLYADLSGLPPLLIHVGADECLRDDSTRVAEKARAARTPVELKVWPVVPHAWQLAQSLLPEARQSLRESTEFLLKHAATAN